MKFELNTNNTIMLTVTGSHAYGTATADSDLDLRGVCIAPLRLRLSYIENFEQADGDQPALRREVSPTDAPWEDCTIFDVAKAARLMANANPNMLELLWAPLELHLINAPAWQDLRQHRDLFLSTKCQHSFTGYAHAQLHKIKAKRKHVHEGLSAGLDIETLTLRERLTVQHGFDTKHAMHLIRLMRMGLEILRGDGVVVQRPDADELQAIRRGQVGYDEVLAMADDLERKIVEAALRSPLPYSADHVRINELLYDMTTGDLR